MEPYVVNVSSINDFMHCRWRWWAKWVMNYVPLHDAAPLRFGKLLHVVFERHLRGMAMAQAIARTREEWQSAATNESDALERTLGYKAIGTLDDLTEALLLWSDQYPFETHALEIEEPFEFEFRPEMPSVVGEPAILLRGRPDRMGVMGGELWHVQNRGLAAGVNFGVYTELAKRHYHEHVYAMAMHKKYPNIPYGGTLFNLVRKLKYRTNKGKKNEAIKPLTEMFFQHPMVVDLESSLHSHIKDVLTSHILEMIRVEREWLLYRRIPAPNEGANGGFFHNKPDEFFRVLTGEIELDDPRYFRPRIDTYAATEED